MVILRKIGLAGATFVAAYTTVLVPQANAKQPQANQVVSMRLVSKGALAGENFRAMLPGSFHGSGYESPDGSLSVSSRTREISSKEIDSGEEGVGSWKTYRRVSLTCEQSNVSEPKCWEKESISTYWWQSG